MIKVCIAGVTGWTGSAIAKCILESSEFELVSAVSRKAAGTDVGSALGLNQAAVTIEDNLECALSKDVDVLIEYTHASSVKQNVMTALNKNVRTVIGASGLSATDFEEIDKLSNEKGLGVIAAGNFSITAALAKHFSLVAAKYLPSWEIIDYAGSYKQDAPSGTTRELAEEMAKVSDNKVEVALDSTLGIKEARGATIGGAQVHSLRLPGYTISFESLFGLPDERLTIRHDAGTSAMPYVQGTLLATKEVMNTTGLIRGLDTLLFNH